MKRRSLSRKPHAREGSIAKGEAARLLIHGQKFAFDGDAWRVVGKGSDHPRFGNELILRLYRVGLAEIKRVMRADGYGADLIASSGKQLQSGRRLDPITDEWVGGRAKQETEPA